MAGAGKADKAGELALALCEDFVSSTFSPSCFDFAVGSSSSSSSSLGVCNGTGGSDELEAWRFFTELVVVSFFTELVDGMPLLADDIFFTDCVCNGMPLPVGAFLTDCVVGSLEPTPELELLELEAGLRTEENVGTGSEESEDDDEDLRDLGLRTEAKDGAARPEEGEEALSSTLEHTTAFANRPCSGGHEKYRTPATEPSFLPPEWSSCTPTQTPAAKAVSPMKRTMPTLSAA